MLKAACHGPDTECTIPLTDPPGGTNAMPNANTRKPISRPITTAAIAIVAAATLSGCHTSSKSTLGFRPNPVVQDRYAVTASVGAAMFGRHVRLAHAEANALRLKQDSFATFPVEAVPLGSD